MLSFVNDYSEGAHEEVLKRLMDTNRESVCGYGLDKYCNSAKEKIKKACECSDADVYFLVGGTQTNQAVISTMLENYEGIIAATSAHISSHEAGAIEYTGHKVLTVPSYEGKLKASDVRKLIETFHKDENFDHMVFPGMVYISHPTEYGTLYTKLELKELSDTCKEFSIPLYLDGARLGYGLAAAEIYNTNEINNAYPTLADIAKYCSVFYIGGTKVGALCGEALVFTKSNTPKHFFTQIKQHGALLAKGKLLGIQFDTLFSCVESSSKKGNGNLDMNIDLSGYFYKDLKSTLYFNISKNAIETAEMLREVLKDKGYDFYITTITNQIFVVLENNQMKKLQEKVNIAFWENIDVNHTVVRFATSWATTKAQIEEVTELL